MIAMVTTEVNRMGHMPTPPWWKCVEIEVNMNFLSDGPRSGMRLRVWALRKCKRGSTAQPGEISRVVQISTWLRAVASRDASRRNATAPSPSTWGPGESREPVAMGHVKADIRLSLSVGIIDLGVATVVLVTLVLPAREMYGSV